MKKYIPHIIIALIIFIAGRYSSPDYSKEIRAKWEQERKVFQEAIGQKDARIVQLNEQGKKQSQRVADLEMKAEASEEKARNIETRYKKKLAALAKYTPIQRDSFFLAKYPGQDTIRNVDSRKVMQDLVRGEWQDSLNAELKKQVVAQKEVISEQKEQIKTEQEKFSTQKEITQAFVRLAESEREEKEYYIKRYRKQRNQKGVLTAGIVGLLILIIAK